MSFFDKIDMTKKVKAPSVINLAKSGDSHTINLTKKTGEFLVNLNWNSSVETKGLFGFLSKSTLDLDLGCMYRLKDGTQGVIQALGNSFGSVSSHPYISLDKDDRTGQSSDGENLRLTKLELVDFVVVYAFIYEGAPNWDSAKGVVTVKQQDGADIVIKLDNPEKGKIMCGLIKVQNKEGKVIVTKLEQYFGGHKELDKAFGFGFNWTAGSK
ncbi:MAG: tellurium resistance protein [Sporomusaceae bacterium]|nr:tellurium resistance protein [Sporomusaceae bacterium]